MNIKPTSIKIYLALVVILIILRVVLIFLPADYIVPAQAGALNWQALIITVGLGFVGVWLSTKTGFPEIWDTNFSTRQKLLVPALIGLGSGLLFRVIEQFQPLGNINIPFPASIPFYLYGGIISEILFRLFIIPLPLWLISSLLLRRRGQEGVFWGVAIITSFLEPLSQVGALYQLGLLNNGISPYIALLILLTYAVNLIAAYLFRKSGFVAPVVMRLAFYLIWHISF
jgi:hypothetical protein